MKTTDQIELNVQNHPFFKNIDSICEAVGIDPKLVKRGYARKSGEFLPSNPKIYVWWPSSNSEYWENMLSNDGQQFRSRGKKESFDLSEVIESVQSGRKVAIFFKKAGTPYGYQFVGVFKPNLEKSRAEHYHVFDLVSDYLSI